MSADGLAWILNGVCEICIRERCDLDSCPCECHETESCALCGETAVALVCDAEEDGWRCLDSFACQRTRQDEICTGSPPDDESCRMGDDDPVTITEFYSARLDEDEAAAKAAPGSTWHAFGEDDVAGASVYDDQWLLLNPARYEHDNALSGKPGATGPQYIQRARDGLCAHIARHDPARVLREVAARRAILAAYAEHADYDLSDPEPEYASGHAAGLGVAVRHLVAVYSSHPDYDPAWRPR